MDILRIQTFSPLLVLHEDKPFIMPCGAQQHKTQAYNLWRICHLNHSFQVTSSSSLYLPNVKSVGILSSVQQNANHIGYFYGQIAPLSWPTSTKWRNFKWFHFDNCELDLNPTTSVKRIQKSVFGSKKLKSSSASTSKYLKKYCFLFSIVLS